MAKHTKPDRVADALRDICRADNQVRQSAELWQVLEKHRLAPAEIASVAWRLNNAGYRVRYPRKTKQTEQYIDAALVAVAGLPGFEPESDALMVIELRRLASAALTAAADLETAIKAEGDSV